MWLVSAAMLWIVHRHVVGASYFAGIPIHRGFDGLVQLRHAHLSALRPENYCVLVRNVKSHQREAPDLLRFFQSVFRCIPKEAQEVPFFLISKIHMTEYSSILMIL